MESHTKIFTNYPYSKPLIPFYTYQTPPYTFSYNYSAWPETLYQPFSMNEDVVQMQQQLRFPTPPTTPPRGCNNNITPEFAYAPQPHEQTEHNSQQQRQQRTQSVIMKVGHDQNPQYLQAGLSYETFAENTKQTQTALQSQGHQHQDHQYDDQYQLQNHHDTPSSGTSSPTSNNEFICDWVDCGRYFESLELLAHHVTLIHAVASLTDGLYYCRWTGCQRTQRGFNARYKMLVHVRTHTKEKPHQCHLCDKRFSRAENLKIHIRSHSGEKPYICTFEGCNKAYSNSSDRFKHTRTHSMEKPYMCKVAGCQKRYTDPSSLRKHVKTFKHSVQIMDFQQPTANVEQQTNLNNADEESTFPSIKTNQKFRSYSKTPKESADPKNQDTFCMALEEMCHIKASFNCYSAAASEPIDRESYWLQETNTNDVTEEYHQHSSANQYATTYTVQLDSATETPLDLSVKRC